MPLDFNKSTFLQHRPPDLSKNPSFIRPPKPRTTLVQRQDVITQTPKAKNKTSDRETHRSGKPRIPESPQRLSLDRLRAFSYPAISPRSAKRKADQVSRVSPPLQNPKSLSRRKMDLSGVISEEDEVDNLEELMKTVAKAKRIKAMTQTVKPAYSEKKKKPEKTPPETNVLMKEAATRTEGKGNKNINIVNNNESVLQTEMPKKQTNETDNSEINRYYIEDPTAIKNGDNLTLSEKARIIEPTQDEMSILQIDVQENIPNEGTTTFKITNKQVAQGIDNESLSGSAVGAGVDIGDSIGEPKAGNAPEPEVEDKDDEKEDQDESGNDVGNNTEGMDEGAVGYTEDTVLESEKEENQSTILDDENKEYIVVMEFGPEENELLKCPMDINNALRNSIIVKTEVMEVKTNLRRNMLILTTDKEQVAEKWLDIKTFGGKDVNCRYTIQTDTANTTYGVIGPIPCPNLKEDMLRKKNEYMAIINESIRDSTSPVIAVDWITKRVKENNTWVTNATQSIRLQFAGMAPDKVYMDRMSYTVGEYVQEPVQCYNCQNYGHTSKHCNSQPVCVFCSVKGHRVKEKK